MSGQDEFVSQVREALHHLYDYHYLESHPLALRYWPEPIRVGPSRAQRFNRLLLESIEELNPPDVSLQDTSRARFYSLLVYRYVEEWSLPDIMRELGYSRSQFFREQRKAIAMLAALLRSKLPPVQHPQRVRSVTEPTDLLNAEAERVLAQREAVDPAEIVRGVLEVVDSLAKQHGVTLECDLGPQLSSIYGSRTLLRQVFLNGLSSLITQPSAGRVRVRMHCKGQKVIVELSAEPVTRRRRSDEALGRGMASPEPVRRLVEMVGGRWQGVEVTPGRCTWRFDFPTDGQKVLLVIEDNEGIIRSFRRYLADYGYRVVGTTTGDEALRLAHEVRPTAITLDVLMPTQDGWEILQALKSDLVTQHIPVIICSVLEDPELARSLGAAAYLCKPVTQADLLGALDSLP